MQFRVATWRSALLVILSVVLANSRPIPVLDLDDLTKKADVILSGRVASVRETGKTVLAFQSQEVPARIMIGEMRVDKILKGPIGESSLKVRFLLPESPVGYHSVAPLSYRVFFLKRTVNDYEFVSPYYPSVVAVSGVPVQAVPDIERVVEQVAGVLHSSSSSLEQKREAVFVLSRTRNGAATLALRPGLREEDVTLRLSTAAALLERNDTSGLNIAEEALLSPNPNTPQFLLHNLSYAISEGVKDDRAIPTLAKLLHAPSPETRRAAVSALRHTGSRSAISALVEALEDPDIEVRYYGVIGLAEITGQSEWRPNMDEFRSDPKRYLSYWADWARFRK